MSQQQPHPLETVLGGFRTGCNSNPHDVGRGVAKFGKDMINLGLELVEQNKAIANDDRLLPEQKAKIRQKNTAKARAAKADLFNRGRLIEAEGVKQSRTDLIPKLRRTDPEVAPIKDEFGMLLQTATSAADRLRILRDEIKRAAAADDDKALAVLDSRWCELKLLSSGIEPELVRSAKEAAFKEALPVLAQRTDLSPEQKQAVAVLSNLTGPNGLHSITTAAEVAAEMLFDEAERVGPEAP
jgi:hypothetical protein